MRPRLAVLFALGLCGGSQATAQDCRWTEVDSAPGPRVEAQSVVIRGKLYLFGGFSSAGGTATPRTDVYDPVTDTWRRLADIPIVVTHHTAAADGLEVWIAGGFFGNNGGWVVNNVQRYDVRSDTWSKGPALPGRRAGGALVRLGRELHFFGGFSTRNKSAGDHYVLDLDDVSAGWDALSFAPLPVDRGHLSGALLDGVIYAIGGQLGHDNSPVDLDLVDAYDAQSNTWIPRASLPTPRSHFEASTFVWGGRLYVAGGRNNQPGGAGALQDVVVFDPALGSWSQSITLPQPLIASSAKPIGDTLIVSAGANASNVPGDEQHRRPLGENLGQNTRTNAGGLALSLAANWCQDSYFSSGHARLFPHTPSIANTTDDAL